MRVPSSGLPRFRTSMSAAIGRFRWWRDVLVAGQPVVRIEPTLERLQAFKAGGAKCGTHALNRFVGLHIVDVTASIRRPGLDRLRCPASPGDALAVMLLLFPDGHRADVECRVPKAS